MTAPTPRGDALAAAVEALEASVRNCEAWRENGGGAVAMIPFDHARTILAALAAAEQAHTKCPMCGEGFFMAGEMARAAEFAKQAVKDEREAIACMADAAARPEPKMDGRTLYGNPTMAKLAAAIRARGAQQWRDA